MTRNWQSACCVLAPRRDVGALATDDIPVDQLTDAQKYERVKDRATSWMIGCGIAGAVVGFVVGVGVSG